MLALALAVALQVRETAGVTRVREVVRSGIPLPRSLNVTSTASLAVIDANGAAVPAEFRVLARWNAGLSATTAPIQWVLVAFPASAGANATSTYRLITDGSAVNPPPQTPLRLTANGDRIIVDTGAAVFTLRPNGTLFEEIRAGNAVVAVGGALTARVNGRDNVWAAARRMTVEHSGPLSAVVIIDGTYDMPPVGGGGLASHRRYIFTAGSGTAIVQQSVSWEGNRCGGQGVIACNGAPNALRVEQVRNTVGGAVAAVLDHEERYEPQAVRTLPNGDVAIDIAAGPVWLGARQGLFATFAVGIDGNAEAMLERPLRAWPDAAWWNASDAVGEIPAGALPAQFAGYDAAVKQALARTLSKRDELHVDGLMTFGLFPRLWGNPIYTDEIACVDSVTPNDPSDDLYWCTLWTDYHNAAATAPVWAMRSGETEWLDEIARPAALRMLYTQIFQCAPGDGTFYCGQAPAGYGGYRADFNSSHAYFDNMLLYYWMTGDSTVVETLQRGATSMREYLCIRRPAAACQPNDSPVDEYANLTGRVASQWNSVFRFVGLAGDDASFLDDYRANLARAVTQQYVAADQNGTRFGFLLGGWQPVAAAGTYTSDQIWMTALYDMELLDRLRRDTGDATIGDLRPSEVLLSLARTFERFASARWPNQLDFTWSGPHVGGTLLSVRDNGGGSDPFLYDQNRATLSGPIARAAAQSGDARLRELATLLTTRAIADSLANGSPLGKEQGELLSRLHAAVANLAPPATPAQRKRAVRR
jgi:YetA-like protein